MKNTAKRIKQTNKTTKQPTTMGHANHKVRSKAAGVREAYRIQVTLAQSEVKQMHFTHTLPTVHPSTSQVVIK